MTNHWIDIRNSDCILIMGSNAAENHPISFQMDHRRHETRRQADQRGPPVYPYLLQGDFYAALAVGNRYRLFWEA
jgi:formate dehydrogenase major subunit